MDDLGSIADAGAGAGAGHTSAPESEPTFAEKVLSSLRNQIESGQAALGAQGQHSNNSLVNPVRTNNTLPIVESGEKHELTPPTTTSSIPVVPATVVSGAAPMSPRSAHAMAAAAHAEAQRKRRALEDAKHKKERDDKLSRYLALIVCIVVIILCIIGMAAISRRVIGKWWHGAPDPIPDTTSATISHTPLFPFSK